MERPFQLFQQLRDALQRQSLAQAHGTRPHDKPAGRFRRLAGIQTQPQVVVCHFLEGLSVAAHLLLQLGADIVIEREGSSHILMLAWRHHDAQPAGQVVPPIGDDPEGDIQFVMGPVDSLGHSSRLPNRGSKMGVDATRKGPGEIRMPEEVKRRGL